MNNFEIEHVFNFGLGCSFPLRSGKKNSRHLKKVVLWQWRNRWGQGVECPPTNKRLSTGKFLATNLEKGGKEKSFKKMENVEENEPKFEKEGGK